MSEATALPTEPQPLPSPRPIFKKEAYLKTASKCVPSHKLSFQSGPHQVVEDSDLGGDGEVEVDEVDVVRSGLEDVRLFRKRFRVSVVEPSEQQLRVLDDDQRLDDRRLEELLDEALLDLIKSFINDWLNKTGWLRMRMSHPLDDWTSLTSLYIIICTVLTAIIGSKAGGSGSQISY